MIRRIDRYSEVIRCCTEAIVIGGGPSLTPEQCETVRLWRQKSDDRRVVGVNNAYTRCSWMDVLYFADAGKNNWLSWHRDRAEFQTFAGHKVTNDYWKTFEPGIHVLRYAAREAFSDDPGKLVGGVYANGGMQAINLAALAGAKRIVLLGFDARRIDGKDHWHPPHARQLPDGPVFSGFIRSMSAVAPELESRGVRVINASPGSAIDAFETMDLEDALAVADTAPTCEGV